MTGMRKFFFIFRNFPISNSCVFILIQHATQSSEEASSCLKKTTGTVCSHWGQVLRRGPRAREKVCNSVSAIIWQGNLNHQYTRHLGILNHFMSEQTNSENKILSHFQYDPKECVCCAPNKFCLWSDLRSVTLHPWCYKDNCQNEWSAVLCQSRLFPATLTRAVPFLNTWESGSCGLLHLFVGGSWSHLSVS